MKEYEATGKVGNAKSITVKANKLKNTFQLELNVAGNQQWAWSCKTTLQDLCEVQYDYTIPEEQMYDWIQNAVKEGTFKFKESDGEEFLSLDIDEEDGALQTNVRIPIEGSLDRHEQTQGSEDQPSVEETPNNMTLIEEEDDLDPASNGTQKSLKAVDDDTQSEIQELKKRVKSLEDRLLALEGKGSPPSKGKTTSAPQKKDSKSSTEKVRSLSPVKKEEKKEEDEKDLTVGQAKVVTKTKPQPLNARFGKRPRKM